MYPSFGYYICSAAGIPLFAVIYINYINREARKKKKKSVKKLKKKDNPSPPDLLLLANIKPESDITLEVEQALNLTRIGSLVLERCNITAAVKNYNLALRLNVPEPYRSEIRTVLKELKDKGFIDF